MLFDPRIVFISLWLLEFTCQVLFGGVFGVFATETWVIVLFAVIAFMFGAQLIQSYGGIPAWIDQRLRLAESQKAISPHLKISVLLIYGMAAVLVMHRIVEMTDILVVARPLECLRLRIIQDHMAERDIAGLLKFFIFGVALSLTLLNDVAHSSKKLLFIFALMGVLSALASTGRLLVLQFFMALTYLMYVQKKWGYKEIVISLIGFLLLFFIIAFAMNKAPAEEWMKEKEWSCQIVDPARVEKILATIDSKDADAIKSLPSSYGVKSSVQVPSSSVFTLFDRLSWNAQTYLLASLAAFDNFVKTGQPQIDGGAFLPNVARTVLNYFGADMALRPAVNPVAEIAMRTNTYTALFPLYHDFGKLGVLIWFFILGCLHQFLYKMSQKKEHPIFRYFYGISLYPLSMIIFEEAYVSSPGFWAIFILTPLFMGVVNHSFSRIIKQL